MDRREYNTRSDLVEIVCVCDGVDWIRVTQDNAQRRALVNTVMRVWFYNRQDIY
jgi:hypothetical protein